MKKLLCVVFGVICVWLAVIVFTPIGFSYSGDFNRPSPMRLLAFVSINSLFSPFPNKPWCLPVCSTSLLKTLWEKKKLLVMSNFSFSPNVFYPFGNLSAIFIKFETVVCKLFQF